MKAAVGSDIERKFQAAPHAQFVKGVAQIILDDLLGGANHLADFAVSLAFPNQRSDLDFFGG
jgi:hypothetical protein